jgi:hypothetical protein
MMKIDIFKIRAQVMVALTLILLLTCVSALHAGPRIKPGLRVSLLGIDGQFGATTSGGGLGIGSSADALGLDTETIFQPQVDFDWEKWHLWLIGFKADYSGSGTAEATIQLGNLPPITAGTPVQSDVGFTYITANLIYDIIPTDVVEIGIGLGGGVVDYELAFQSEISPLRVTTGNTLPFAYLLLRIGKEFGRFGLLGSVGGISVEFSGHDISYLQADVSASYRIFGEEDKLQGHVALGYQYFRMDYEYEDQGGIGIIDVTLDGPYLAFALSF